MVGVSRVGDCSDFPYAPAAARGADAFAAWAIEQGYDVYAFIDEPNSNVAGAKLLETGTITVSRIYARLQALSNDDELRTLLVYFNGHGISPHENDACWMLSDGPDHPREGAISVHKSIEDARTWSHLERVAVFADACRSLAAGAADKFNGKLQSQGQSIFEPQTRTRTSEFHVDVFSSAAAMRPAYDIPADLPEEWHSLFTKYLIEGLTGNRVAARWFDPHTQQLIVTPHSLTNFLTSVNSPLAEELKTISDGQAVQTPVCDPGPDWPIAWLGTGQAARLTVHVRLDNGGLANGSLLAILTMDESGREQGTAWKEESPVYVGEHALGSFWGVRATLKYHSQVPPAPDPVTQLLDDQLLEVTMVPE